MTNVLWGLVLANLSISFWLIYVLFERRKTSIDVYLDRAIAKSRTTEKG